MSTVNTIAVYSGTFDPLTLGHEDVARRAAGLFGRLIIAVAIAHHKKTMFTLDERLDAVRAVFAHCHTVPAVGMGHRSHPSLPSMARTGARCTRR